MSSGDAQDPTPDQQSKKTCSSCRQAKPATEYYKKGGRLDARCKACVLQKKSDSYWRGRSRRPTKKLVADQQAPSIQESDSPLTPAQKEIFSSYEFWNALVTSFREHIGQKCNQAVAEFQQSGLTAEEFNSRHYRDDGEIFPILENGEMKMKSVIKLPEGWGSRRQVKPERVLKLYHENLSLQEIAKTLDRSEKWVKRSLSSFGIRFDSKGSRLDPSNIPFGWREKDGKLVTNPSEQWVLDKLDEDFKQGKSPEDLCKFLNHLKVRPRAGKSWVAPMVSKAINTNKRLKSVLLTAPK